MKVPKKINRIYVTKKVLWLHTEDVVSSLSGMSASENCATHQTVANGFFLDSVILM